MIRLVKKPCRCLYIVSISTLVIYYWVHWSINITQRENEIHQIPKNKTRRPGQTQRDTTTKAIPHIVHFTSSWANHDGEIPEDVTKWVATWPKKNPGWKFYIWSTKSVRRLIKKRFTVDLLNLFDSYELDIQRADSMRHFIMYEFGGVYVDLDMECVQPLNNFVDNYTCIISTEPDEHRLLLYNQSQPYLTGAFLASVPKHPFYLMAINQLSQNLALARHLKFPQNVFVSTGPKMIQNVYERYRKLNRHSKLKDAIFIAPPYLTAPKPDGDFKTECLQMESDMRSKETQALCSRVLSDSSGQRSHYKNSYTVHHWHHSYCKSSGCEVTYNFINITDVIEGVLVPEV